MVKGTIVPLLRRDLLDYLLVPLVVVVGGTGDDDNRTELMITYLSCHVDFLL